MFSFIIPVLYEGSSINNLIEQLYQQFAADSVQASSVQLSSDQVNLVQASSDQMIKNFFEIIVVDGDPCGSTIHYITSFCDSNEQSNSNRQQFPSKYPKIKLITSKPGRGTQMNAGAEIADGEILIFLHADTQIASDSLNHISKIMRIGKYQSGAFRLRFDSQRKVYRLIEFFASLRCRITRIPYGDQAIFIKKSYFEKIGRFADIPIMEDIDLMQRIKRCGDRVYISSKFVKTSARRWEKEGIVYCVIRSSVLSLLFRLGVSPKRLLKYYKIFSNQTETRK